MRFKSALSALGIAMTIVVGADYLAVAATGNSFLLGRSNSASTTTTLTRTTNGPTLVLNSKAGQPPIKVNRAVKAPNLNADRLDGLDSSAFARKTRVSAFTPPSCQKLATATATPQKISDLGTFTKNAAGTKVDISLSTHFFVASTAGTGVTYQLRVDNTPTALGRAATLVPEVGVYVPGTVRGIFPGLSAGAHTVSLWARSANGNATNAYYDPGCYSSQGVNNVYVEEFH